MYMASDAQARFSRLGLTSNFYFDAYFQLASAATLQRNDVVLAISHVGRMPYLLEAIDVAREQSATIVAITQPHTPLARSADFVLPIVVPAIVLVIVLSDFSQSAPDWFFGTTRFLGGTQLGLFLEAAAFLILALDLLAFALELRIRQLPDRVLALGIDTLILTHRAALDVGALLAHFDIHGLAARRALVDGQFAYRLALERDLPRRSVFGFFLDLAVRAAQEAEQLDLLRARHDLVGAREFHAGFGKLGDQLVHAHAEHAGQLFDRYIRHFVGNSSILLAALLKPLPLRAPP